MNLIFLIRKLVKVKQRKTTTVGNKVEKIICILKRAEQQGMIDIHESKLDKYKKAPKVDKVMKMRFI